MRIVNDTVPRRRRNHSLNGVIAKYAFLDKGQVFAVRRMINQYVFVRFYDTRRGDDVESDHRGRVDTDSSDTLAISVHNHSWTLGRLQETYALSLV